MCVFSGLPSWIRYFDGRGWVQVSEEGRDPHLLWNSFRQFMRCLFSIGTSYQKRLYHSFISFQGPSGSPHWIFSFYVTENNSTESTGLGWGVSSDLNPFLYLGTLSLDAHLLKFVLVTIYVQGRGYRGFLFRHHKKTKKPQKKKSI